MQFHRIRATRATDVHLLQRFYDDVYVPEFPDPDEREELITIRRYLALKEEGWYGENNYHVILCTEGEAVIGGSISDYLTGPNVGVIEFIVISPGRRSEGLGHRLLDETEQTLRADAAKSGRRLACIYAEIDDPRRVSTSGFDPIIRTRIWHRWGYRAVDIPYVQPALSPEQSPVADLILAVKTDSQTFGNSLPANHVAEVLREYMRWAMRISDPADNAEYRQMLRSLTGQEDVLIKPLVEQDPSICVREVTDVEDPELDDVIRLYESVFSDPSTAVPGETFRAMVGAAPSAAEQGFNYHLWTLRASSDADLEGMISFLTLTRSGFGGYGCMTGSLRGSGRLRGLLALVESRIRRDRPEAHGWYVECAGDVERAIFCKVGFAELAVPYSQPESERDGLAELPLHLLYKPMDPSAAPSRLAADIFLHDIGEIYRSVYAMQYPERAPAYQRLRAALTGMAEVPLLDDAAADTPSHHLAR